VHDGAAEGELVSLKYAREEGARSTGGTPTTAGWRGNGLNTGGGTKKPRQKPRTFANLAGEVSRERVKEGGVGSRMPTRKGSNLGGTSWEEDEERTTTTTKGGEEVLKGPAKRRSVRKNEETSGALRIKKTDRGNG